MTAHAVLCAGDIAVHKEMGGGSFIAGIKRVVSPNDELDAELALGALVISILAVHQECLPQRWLTSGTQEQKACKCSSKCWPQRRPIEARLRACAAKACRKICTRLLAASRASAPAHRWAQRGPPCAKASCHFSQGCQDQGMGLAGTQA